MTAGAVGVFIAAIAALLVFLRALTDYQWFASLGQQRVLVTQVLSAGGLLLVGSLASFAVIFSCGRAAQAVLEPEARSPRLVLWSAVVLSVATNLGLASQWSVIRLALVQVPFGVSDPQTGFDVGFFVFTLPALQVLAGWFTSALFLAIVFAVAAALIPSRATGSTPLSSEQWSSIRAMVQRLAAVMVMGGAVGYVLSVLGLSLSNRTASFGASYTDVHAQLPAYIVMLVLTAVLSVILFVTARSKRLRVPVFSIGVWVISAFLISSLWPAIVQQYGASPNDIALEKPYIERNIKMTREAFDLSAVQGQQYSVSDTFTPETSAKTQAALADARIWTPETVKQAYSQLQTIRPYYRLSKIDTDRYEVNGESRQVLVSARVIDTSLLPKRAQTWANRHLVYTHGYGMVISASSGASERGFPLFLVGDVPPQVSSEASGSPALQTTQPRIYFGPGMSDYAIVDTGVDEFDYPQGETNVKCRYESKTGIALDSVFERIAWALRLGSNEVVLSSYLKPTSRLLFNRDISARVQRIAPWLQYDKDPYPALVDGRITWILDGYTSSANYPYSQPLSDGTNYIRDSVKVSVDALTGDMHFYAIGEDPIRDSWAKIFPTVLTPADQIPASLAEHFRYPKRMFSAQTSVYRMYHMTDSQVFYNKEDQWQIPGKGSTKVKPTYLMVDLPDSKSGRGFYLMQPYSPANRDNMIGWMAASCDPQDFGKQTVYLLPKDRVILGAQQVTARINQDPIISPQLSLWNQRGSHVLFGDMLVLPVDGTIAYVQPLFLQAEKSAATELVGVVVVAGERLEMAGTLHAALAKVFGPDAGSAMEATTPADKAAAAVKVDALLEQVVAAKQKGDFAAYSAGLKALQGALDELLSTTQAK